MNFDCTCGKYLDGIRLIPSSGMVHIPFIILTVLLSLLHPAEMKIFFFLVGGGGNLKDFMSKQAFRVLGVYRT